MSITVLERSIAIYEPAAEVRRRDRTAWGLALVACSASIASFIYYYRKGDILLYEDSVSHMEIARRVIDSPTTGFGQLGGVWLPLPHLLMVPFVSINWLYYSGLAGSITSMASYIIASVYLYKIILDLTDKRLPAVVGALVFMGNPNILYMQSTPMTELLLFAGMTGMVYYVQRWIRTDENIYLYKGGIATFLGTLARYEAWVLFAELTVIIVIAAWRKGYKLSQIEGKLLAYLSIAGLGILGWIGWNLLIFHDALYFQFGPYAKPSLWVGSTTDQSVGHWSVAVKTYWYAVADNLQVVIILLALIGLVAILARERLRLQTWPVLAFLGMFPFFVIALEKGQRPISVTQLGSGLYNVRFGLLMVLPAAVLIGYVASIFSRRWLKGAVAIALVLASTGVSAFVEHQNAVDTLNEPTVWSHEASAKQFDAAGAFMKQHYHGGVILAQFFGNEEVLFKAHISLGNNLYEGSYKMWQPALANPMKFHVKWIIMRNNQPPDMVYKALHNSAILLSNYMQVYSRDGTYIYERKT